MRASYLVPLLPLDSAIFIDNVNDTHSLNLPVVAVGNAVRERGHWMFESSPCFVTQHFGPGVPESSSSQFGR